MPALPINAFADSLASRAWSSNAAASSSAVGSGHRSTMERAASASRRAANGHIPFAEANSFACEIASSALANSTPSSHSAADSRSAASRSAFMRSSRCEISSAMPPSRLFHPISLANACMAGGIPACGFRRYSTNAMPR